MNGGEWYLFMQGFNQLPVLPYLELGERILLSNLERGRVLKLTRTTKAVKETITNRSNFARVKINYQSEQVR